MQLMEDEQELLQDDRPKSSSSVTDLKPDSQGFSRGFSRGQGSSNQQSSNQGSKQGRTDAKSQFQQEITLRGLLEQILVHAQQHTQGLEERIGRRVQYVQDWVYLQQNDPSYRELLQFQLSDNYQLVAEARDEAVDAVLARESLMICKILEGEQEVGQAKRQICSKFQLEQFDRQSVIKMLKVKEKEIREGLLDISKLAPDPNDMRPRASLRQIARDQRFRADPSKQKEVQQYLNSLRMRRAKDRRLFKEMAEKEAERKETQRKLIQASLQQARLNRKRQAQQKHARNQKQRLQAQQLRAKNHRQFVQYVKRRKSNKPLFEAKAQKEKQLQQQSLRQRQLRLQSIKRQTRAIRKEQLDQHQARYEQVRQQNEQRRRDCFKLVQNNIAEQAKDYFKGRYYSQSEARVDPLQKKQELIEAQKRVRDYAQRVKEDYKPKVDPSKRHQLMQLIQANLPTAPRQSTDEKLLGKNYLQSLRYLPKKRRAVSVLGNYSMPIPEQKEDTQAKKDEKGDILRNNKGDSKKEGRSASKGEAAEQDRPRRKWEDVGLMQLQRDLGNNKLSAQQKYQRLRSNLVRLQQRCKRGEQLVRVQGQSAGQRRLSLDKYYLSSIKAQVGLLSELAGKQ